MRLFDWLGGMVRECVYDNLCSPAAKGDGDDVRWNAGFHICAGYAFHATA